MIVTAVIGSYRKSGIIEKGMDEVFSAGTIKPLKQIAGTPGARKTTSAFIIIRQKAGGVLS